MNNMCINFISTPSFLATRRDTNFVTPYKRVENHQGGELSAKILVILIS
jgi:hypothetical protein